MACVQAYLFGREMGLRNTHIMQVHLRKLGATDALRLDRVYEVEGVELVRRGDAHVQSQPLPSDVFRNSSGYLVCLDEVDRKHQNALAWLDIPVNAEYERTQAWLHLAADDCWPALLRDRLHTRTSDPVWSGPYMALPVPDLAPFRFPAGIKSILAPDGSIQFKRDPDRGLCVPSSLRWAYASRGTAVTVGEARQARGTGR